MKHIPVLLNEVLKTLEGAPLPGVSGTTGISGKTIIDCTFGAGGYSRAFLERGASVIAFDRDPSAAPAADALTRQFGYDRFRFINQNFSGISDLSKQYDAIVFDLGISSMQIDQPARGFSFREDARLDMRMSMQGLTAAELIRRFHDTEDTIGLAKILREYGDIRNARGLAKKILANPPETTFQLKGMVSNSRDVAPVFQALRIAVNDEFGEIAGTLRDAVPALLRTYGICICVTFHSLEDRIVKNIFREWTTVPGDPRLPAVEVMAPFKMLKTLTPSDVEIAGNPRARSAHLRAVMKL